MQELPQFRRFTSATGRYRVTGEKWSECISAWKTAFPEIDLAGEMKKAAGWLEVKNHPKRDLLTFLGNWFAIAVKEKESNRVEDEEFQHDITQDELRERSARERAEMNAGQK